MNKGTGSWAYAITLTTAHMCSFALSSISFQERTQTGHTVRSFTNIVIFNNCTIVKVNKFQFLSIFKFASHLHLLGLRGLNLRHFFLSFIPLHPSISASKIYKQNKQWKKRGTNIQTKYRCGTLNLYKQNIYS